MAWSIRALAVACALTGAFGLGGCSGKTTQAGGLEVVVQTAGLTAGADFDSIEVSISQQEGSTWHSLTDLTRRVPSEVTLPTTVSVAAGNTPNPDVRIEVTALLNGTPRVQRVAQLQVPSQRVAELLMVLSESCVGMVGTCAGGSCQPNTGTCGSNLVDTNTLPDYKPGDENRLDGGFDATTAPMPVEAGGDDATVTTPEGDANTDANPDADAEAGPPICPPGSDGQSCGPDPDLVCSGGACVTCTHGGDCTDPAAPCMKKSYDCSTGVAVCMAAGNATNGSACSATDFCYDGVCSPCTLNAPCAPAAAPCNVGKVASCTNGVPQCQDTGVAAASGTSCTLSADGGGGSAVCNAGVCAACTPHAACNPGNNACQLGTLSCATGVSCTATGPAADNTVCGSNSICLSGACVTKCDATSCAAGCCAGNTCQTTEVASACGTGGAACQACAGSTPNCVAKACATCTSGSKQCAGNASQTCGATGSWGAPVACAANQTCVSGTCGGQCGPGQLTCSGAQPQSCSASGTWQNQGAACSGATPTCQGGSCVCSNACTNGATECVTSNALSTCSAPAGGCTSWGAQTSCTAQTGASGAALVCERAGTASCADPNWAEWPMPNTPNLTAGVPHLASYTNNGDGTVTDNVTSLMWQQTASSTQMTQAASVTYCQGLNLAGHADWRLPSIIELTSIVDLAVANPSINTQAFPSASSGIFWSSTQFALLPGNAYTVEFGRGSEIYGGTGQSENVRCVR
jgi:hypothetical protein